ncbi:ribosomal large subunit pseudouridine synthase D (plasmid) [Legionella adelaidensis]|uniref:Pseudouridine synthase n=1 Tax=Legionella adelaidensis TaxID=45056 RepID=A0A0W0R4E8_9GAMM|nr:23S rRNA pseudouridine(1911/1915/1917) synthase RluD [Legionella adelaidensis]KTC65942.1 ribosomal large, subunit pseudouridine synthase D [Legionella adelaidensis]VEH85562.1 ribosomal large subunit pseudouridine synthase D [Legionella adelaidensis]
MTKLIEHQLTIPILQEGKRVDAVLAELFPEYSRSQLSSWLKAGFITINKRVYKPKEKVFGGENLEIKIIPQVEESSLGEDIPLAIIYEDEHLIIINKPAGLVVHPGAGNLQHTLVNALIHHNPDLQQLPRAGIIHRLDKDTTGLLIVAKTLHAHTQLIRQMQAREIQRHYLALVNGHVISGKRIETFFGRHPKNRLKMAVCNHGKEAITEFSIRKHYNSFTLLDVKLFTGRTHQIRVHLSHINYPIVGDSLYGGRLRIPPQATDQLKQMLQQFKRQALHAYHLSFTHPISKQELTFSAPIPDDFQLLLNLLDAYCENISC